MGLIKIYCMFGGKVEFKVSRIEIGTDSAQILKDQLDGSPVQNAVAYVNIFKDGVPALIKLAQGFLRIGEKRTESQYRLSEKKLETELRIITLKEQGIIPDPEKKDHKKPLIDDLTGEVIEGAEKDGI